jgi:hypothetical protein
MGPVSTSAPACLAEQARPVVARTRSQARTGLRTKAFVASNTVRPEGLPPVARESRARMSDLLTDIRRNIDARLDEVRPAVTEYSRLEEALAALTETDSTAKRQRGGPSTRAPSARNPGPASSRGRNAQRVSSPPSPPARARSKRPPGRGRSQTKRAARGANQAAVVAALRRMGSATVPELAETTNVKPGVLYALTRARRQGRARHREDEREARLRAGRIGTAAPASALRGNRLFVWFGHQRLGGLGFGLLARRLVRLDRRRLRNLGLRRARRPRVLHLRMRLRIRHARRVPGSDLEITLAPRRDR